jgi:hypothetical protein
MSDLLYLNIIKSDPINLNYNFLDYNMLFTNLNLTSTSLQNNSLKLVEELSNLTIIKNDTLKLNGFIGDYSTEKNLLDIESWFYDQDNSSINQQEISTPDVKLYYPEPFIASPSFNHEEI